MKKLLYTFFFFSLYINVSTATNNNSFREDFHNNDLNKENVERMIASYSSDNSTVDQAYLGVCQAIMAQYVFLPTSKLKSFYDGKDLLDESIEENKDNGEQRYLRLLIQLNAPSFLFYNKNIDTDLEVFMEDVRDQNIDPEWSVIFIDNLLKGKKLSKQQIEELTLLKKQLL